MTHPFSGMNPYLEAPGLWPDVHNRLIVSIADDLAPALRPRYYVAIEERTYLAEPEDAAFVGRADAAVVTRSTPPVSVSAPFQESGGVAVAVALPDLVRESYLEVHAVADGRVVTVIEALSPANKRPGEGRALYLRKRLAVLGSLSHLVEIDLLRAGEPMPVRGWTGVSDYRILISRGNQRPRALLIPFSVRQPIPRFAVPLDADATEPEIDLGALLRAIDERAAFDLRIDYRRDPEPPLTGDDAAWADRPLRQSGLRQDH
ncbi:DUF4058 family protein [Roseiflexus castenholzii]|uniref:DUF4058 domain-containing protein n=1 Tax=Roseiflexus castenholzii (strain DSM 13941 / HLO8) TaxID=383372 RepID=A7NNT3_ROSCS|nr:DUF4058 family protein [Roseiflexus castenholzii]ABU59227.1 conserved hypothetical protein [Roseiflexus castenholzii DSM 13941]